VRERAAASRVPEGWAGQAQGLTARGHGHGVKPQLRSRGREGEEAQPAEGGGGAAVLRLLQPVVRPGQGAVPGARLVK
jgi:hypothetical protein